MALGPISEVDCVLKTGGREAQKESHGPERPQLQVLTGRVGGLAF